MSPSKQKSGGRQVARDQKTSIRQAASGGVGTNAYNPSSGTFHTLEPANTDSETRALSGGFKSIDEADENVSSQGGSADVDCMSNNGSSSGDSEDQLHASVKEKNTVSKTTTNKREKIRGKNERKHQRQKERRAQELKDKCIGYLMLRKLEGLSQKLVAMGFPQDRANMALIVNDGHVEQSVVWLLEGGEGQVQEGLNPGGNLKIDISEELDRLLEIEKKFKIPRPDIEKAVVSCEGDLEKVLEFLQVRGVSTVGVGDHEVESRLRIHAEQSASLPVPSDGSIGCQTGSNVTVYQSRTVRSSLEGRLHSAPSVCTEGLPKGPVQLQPGSSHSTIAGIEKVQPPPLRTVPFVPAFTSLSSAEMGLVFGFGTPNPTQLFPGSAKDQARNVSGKESVNKGRAWSLPQVNPQSAARSIPIATAPLSSPSWGTKGLMEGGSPSSVLHVNDEMRMEGLPPVKHSVRALGVHDLPYQLSSLLTIQADTQASSRNGVGRRSTYDITSPSSPLPVSHSGSSSGMSHGLFTGWGAGMSRSSIDWSSGPSQHCDYRTIDWSMKVSPNTVQGISPCVSSLLSEEKSSHGWSFEDKRRVQTGLKAADFSTELTSGNCCRNVGSIRAGIYRNIPMELRSSDFHEWTTPFGGKALFNLPQTVSSMFL